MQHWSAERADIRDSGAGREGRVRHDRAVAAELVGARIEFDVRAFSGGGDNPLAKLGQRRDGREIFSGAATQPDRRDDGVDEAIEADKSAVITDEAAAGGELLKRALSKHGKRR